MLLPLLVHVAAAESITVHRWNAELDVDADVIIRVEEATPDVTLHLRGSDRDVAVAVVHPVARGGCAAAQKRAPAMAGLDARWRYLGSEYTPVEWCLPTGKGLLKLQFTGDAANFPTLARVVSQLADFPIDPAAPVWTAPFPEVWRYPMITWLTFGWRSMSPPKLNPPGRELFRVALAVPLEEIEREPAPWRIGLEHDVHVMRGLAVGWELRANGLLSEEGGFEYGGRGLVGGGGFFLPHVGAALYTGIGYGGLGPRIPACAEIPLEGLILVGSSNVGVEFLARFSAQLTDERPEEERVLGMHIDPYFRVGGWFGTRHTKRIGRFTSTSPDYSEWGSHVFYLGVFNQRQAGHPYFGFTFGMSYALTEPV